MSNLAASGRKGEAILAQRARTRVVLELVSFHSLALGLLVAVPAVPALFEGEFGLAAALLAAGAPAFLAAAVRMRGRPIVKPRKIEALVSVTLTFVLGALLCVPAFVVLGMPLVDALFEAMSAVTTTGLSVAVGSDTWPLSAHLLRAWVQWGGGFAFATLALALVLGPGVVAQRLGAVQKPGQDLLGSTAERARAVLSAYFAISVLAVILAALVSDAPVDAALLALAAVSTGGFAPRPDSLGGYGTGLQVVVVLAVLAGAISMTTYAQTVRRGPMILLRDGEFRVLAMVVLVGMVAVTAIEVLRPDGAGWWESVFTVASAQSTAGFAVGSMDRFHPASILLLILAMLIGGSLGATAGGMKVFRLVFLANCARKGLIRSRLSANALSHLTVFGRRTTQEEGTDVMALVVLFSLSVGVLWILLTLEGYPPIPALFDTVSAFSTVGLSMGVVGPDLPVTAKLCFTLAMLFGRLEFLAVLACLTPSTWIMRV